MGGAGVGLQVREKAQVLPVANVLLRDPQQRRPTLADPRAMTTPILTHPNALGVPGNLP